MVHIGDDSEIPRVKMREFVCDSRVRPQYHQCVSPISTTTANRRGWWRGRYFIFRVFSTKLERAGSLSRTQPSKTTVSDDASSPMIRRSPPNNDNNNNNNKKYYISSSSKGGKYEEFDITPSFFILRRLPVEYKP